MSSECKVVIAQLQNSVADLIGNQQRIIECAVQAKQQQQADLVVFPELALTGYPPEDLLLRPGFHRSVAQALQQLLEAELPVAVIVGHSEWQQGKLYNAASLLVAGKRVATWRKRHLPNFSVFDEKRYFQAEAAEAPIAVAEIAGFKFCCLICEDIWQPEPVELIRSTQADALLVLNASPFHREKPQQRVALLARRAQQAAMPLLYVHCVGGQDELVFDGGSMAFAADGSQVMQAPFFTRGCYALTLLKQPQACHIHANTLTPPMSEEALVYQALVVGVRDYVQRNNFSGAIIGASGGIDSALTLAIASDALGAENVVAVAMPSQHSAAISCQYAAEQAKLLAVEYKEIPIQSLYAAFRVSLAEEFSHLPVDTTEENLQARIRGVLLMALSNKSGKIVLTTGNKSEMAVGYATLYGDMAGGFAVLKDVFKTWVYKLSHYRNTLSYVIPQQVIDRPPTAELAPRQLDEDSLPPYAVLDEILAAYVEQDQGVAEIVAQGFAKETVLAILKQVDRNEYKRRQSPPGVRVSARAFGRDRRYPITSAYAAMGKLYQ